MTSLRDNCSICLDKLKFPVKLECNHYFCYVCIQQALMNTRICPICKKNVSAGFDLENNINFSYDGEEFPATTSRRIEEDDNDEICWYYEGFKGWWKYDPNISRRIEQEYMKNKRGCFKCNINNKDYTINFRLMRQIRCDDETRLRKIKRDSNDVICKGIAGIRI